MTFWAAVILAWLSLPALQAEETKTLLSEEISSQEKKAAEDLLFKTDYFQKMVAQLKKDHVQWFFMNYRDKDKIVFEFRDKREDMDHYPFIDRLAVNLRTKECFKQGADDEKIR